MLHTSPLLTAALPHWHICSLIAEIPNCAIPSLLCCFTAPQQGGHSLTAMLPHCLVASLPPSSKLHSHTAPLPYCPIASLPHRLNAPLPHLPTVLLPIASLPTASLPTASLPTASLPTASLSLSLTVPAFLSHRSPVNYLSALPAILRIAPLSHYLQ
jgi:hypothetical protein